MSFDSVNPVTPLAEGLVADPERARVARMWLLLAVSALGLSTLQAVLLVLARVPGVATWLPEDAFFRALVLHVDLSILVWFGAFAAVLWTLGNPRPVRPAPWLAMLGTTLMLGAALFPRVQPLMNNYVPVLDSAVFLVGLGIFVAGVCGPALRALPVSGWRRAGSGQGYGALAAALWWLALAMLVLVGWPAAAGSRDAVFFERLFWGAGHVLQFTHVLLMLWVWGILFERSGGGRAPALFSVWFLPGLMCLASALLLPWLEASRGGEGRAFTIWMAATGWLLVVPVGLRYLWFGWRRRHLDPLAWTLLSGSVVLYLVGALAGSFIRGDNLMVPAHYHGAIGAVTLAYMGLAYSLIPALNGRAVSRRAARLQARLYGGGLLFLVGGLAYAGWLGLARKTPAPLLAGHWADYLGLGLAVVGGGLALAGSFYFVVLCLRALRPRADRVAVVRPGEGQ